MAYILWKFFRKRYSKVRKSIYDSRLPENSSQPQFVEELASSSSLEASSLDQTEVSHPYEKRDSVSIPCKVPASSKNQKKQENSDKHSTQVHANKETNVIQRVLELHSRPPEDIASTPEKHSCRFKKSTTQTENNTNCSEKKPVIKQTSDNITLPVPTSKGKKSRGARRNHHKRRCDKECKAAPNSCNVNNRSVLQGRWASEVIPEDYSVALNPYNNLIDQVGQEEASQYSQTTGALFKTVDGAKAGSGGTVLNLTDNSSTSKVALEKPLLQKHCLENQVDRRKNCSNALESRSLELNTSATLSPTRHLPQPSDHVLSVYLVNTNDGVSEVVESELSLTNWKKKRTDVSQLIKCALSPIYNSSTICQGELVRQARDVLVCCYHGNLSKFKDEFLYPAASLLARLKLEERKNALGSSYLDQDGWPLVIHNSHITVHLGEVDARLKVGDFYLCICKGVPTVQLKLKYRCSSLNIKEYVITETEFGSIFTMDWPQSLNLDPQSDEHLASLLEHMLVAVEKGIDRIKWEAVARPHSCIHHTSLVDVSDLGSKDKLHSDCDSASPPVSNDRRHSCPDEQLKNVPTALKGSARDVNVSHSYRRDSDDERCASSRKTVLSLLSDSSTRNNGGRLDELKSKLNYGITIKDSSAQTSPVEESKDTLEAKCSQETNKSTPPPCSHLKDHILQRSSASSSDEKVNSVENASPSIGNLKTDDTGDNNKSTVKSSDEYRENCLVHPSNIRDISPELLNQKIAVLPGCRDISGRSVVVVNYNTFEKSSSCTSSAQIAQLLLYYHATLRKEISRKGLCLLVDVRTTTQDYLHLLNEIISTAEDNISGIVGLVLIWKNGNARPDFSSKQFKGNLVKFETINSFTSLCRFLKADQLPAELGGSYEFDFLKWQEFRKKFEPFVEECRSCGRKLVTVMHGLKSSRLPPTSGLTMQIIDEHKQKVMQILENPNLIRLQQNGNKTLSELESLQSQQLHNLDLRDAMERARILFTELNRATLKLSRLSEKRLSKLEQGLQLRAFEEDSSQVLTWLCKNGEDTLRKHRATADNLMGIRNQERDFEKFYFLAMRNIEKGHDLLEEATVLNQTIINDSVGVKDLSVALKHHLFGFSERLEEVREQLEDTSRCYQMLDKAYEWALDSMKFVSRIKMEQDMTTNMLDQYMNNLQNYLKTNPPLSEDVFSEMIAIASKLKHEKLLEQCKMAQARCQETSDLIQARQSTLLKALLQMNSSNIPQSSKTSPASNGDCGLDTSSSSSWVTPTSNLIHPFTRRRSIAVMPTSGYLLPTGYVSQGYSSFFRETYQLDSYISERDENFNGGGSSSSSIQDVSGHDNSMTHHKPLSDSSSVESNENIAESISPDATNRVQSGSVPPPTPVHHHHSKPHKKYMRRSQTWQLDLDPWQKATDASLETIYQMHKDFEKGSSESINTTLGIEDKPQDESASVSNKKPIPVNTHLHNQTPDVRSLASLRESEGSLSDVEIKQKRTLMLIMSEMIQTERDYVKSLEYVIENYIPDLLREDIPQALRGKRNVIFGNVEKIYEFHNLYFLRELEKCERTPFRVGQCFINFEKQFYLYALYNKNKPKSDDLMLEYGSTFFKSKQLQLGDKMDLSSYLLKPVQRMGKYALLLKQLLKECSEKHNEYADLKAAEDMVKFQLRHGNDLLAMDCIKECDVDLKEQGRLICQDEFLVSQGKNRKCLRHVFLFEDLIVFSKSRRNPNKKGHDIYQYKNSVKMSDIGMTEKIGESNTKFEIWFRKCKLHDTYTFQAPTNEVKLAWTQEITKLLWKQALRNRELRLAEMSSMGIGNKPCLDIKPSQDQISDRSISINQLTRGPKFRNSIAAMCSDPIRSNKRPHSIISVSSSSSGSSQSSYNMLGALNLGFDPTDSPDSRHRSITQQSQCSTESGIVPDIAYENFGDVDSSKKLERTGSNASSDSRDKGSSSVSSPTDSSADLSKYTCTDINADESNLRL